MFSRNFRRAERGQVLMIAALLLPVLLGMAALAVDVGGYASHRRTLQNDADAIALAAARDLPDATAAQSTASVYAAKNGVPAADLTVAVVPQSPSNPNPTVRVTIQREHEFSFIRALGVSSKPVSAVAAAIKTSPGGSASLMPWAVTEAALTSTQPGDLVTLKYDSNNVSNGNFGAIRLDGSGSNVYGNEIKSGSSSVACAQGVTTCTETSPVCTGPVCPSEPGNMVGQTRTGVDYRIANTDAHCDTFGEVFSGPVSGKYSLNSQCNPWVGGSYASLRVVVVPIVTSLCNGSCNLTITSFAMFWLEGYGGFGCTGNTCEIKGRFVNADLTTGALAGIYDANSSLHFVRLSE